MYCQYGRPAHVSSDVDVSCISSDSQDCRIGHLLKEHEIQVMASDEIMNYSHSCMGGEAVNVYTGHSCTLHTTGVGEGDKRETPYTFPLL